MFRCNACGAASEVDTGYRRRWSLRRLGPFVRCPRCDRKRALRWRRWLLAWILALPVLGGVLLGTGWDDGLGYILINVGLLELSVCVATVLHESGHALAARIAGLKVQEVILGMGGRWFEVRVFGVPVRVNALPFGGGTRLGHVRREWARLRHFTAALAGPLANLAAVVLVPDVLRGAELLREGPAPLYVFSLANAGGLVFNLLPMRGLSLAGFQGNDGMALLQIPFWSDAVVDDVLADRYVAEGNQLAEQVGWEEGCRRFEEGLRLHPRSVRLRIAYSAALIALERYADARDALLPVLDRSDLDATTHAVVLNNLARAELCLGGAMLSEADRHSREAFELLPWQPAVRGTRGSVLVELGRSAEGVKLVQEAFQENESEEERALNACYLALGALAEGRREDAIRYREAARGLDPECPLLRRVNRSTDSQSPFSAS